MVAVAPEVAPLSSFIERSPVVPSVSFVITPVLVTVWIQFALSKSFTLLNSKVQKVLFHENIDRTPPPSPAVLVWVWLLIEFRSKEPLPSSLNKYAWSKVKPDPVEEHATILCLVLSTFSLIFI